jgi:hypothetical protein
MVCDSDPRLCVGGSLSISRCMEYILSRRERRPFVSRDVRHQGCTQAPWAVFENKGSKHAGGLPTRNHNSWVVFSEQSRVSYLCYRRQDYSSFLFWKFTWSVCREVWLRMTSLLKHWIFSFREELKKLDSWRGPFSIGQPGNPSYTATSVELWAD